MNKKVKIIIFVSVLINLLLAGVIAGHLSKGFSKYGKSRYDRDKEIARKFDVPEDKIESFRKVLKDSYTDNKTRAKEMGKAREAALELLSAEKFDAASYQKEAKRIHELRGEMMQHFSDSIAALAKNLGQQERKALAEMLRRTPRGYGDKNHSWSKSYKKNSEADSPVHAPPE